MKIMRHKNLHITLVLAVLGVLFSSKTHSQVLYTNGASLYIAPSTLVYADGTIFVSDNNTIQNEGTIELSGDFVFEGTTSPFQGISKKMIFSGKTSSFIANKPAIIDFFDIDVQSPVFLRADIAVHNELHLSRGNIDMGNAHILLGNTGYITGENNQQYITGDADGYIEVHRVLNRPQEVNPGNIGASISSNSDLGPTIIRRGHKTFLSDYGKSINRYYDIIPEQNKELDATLTMSYQRDIDMQGIDSEENIVPVQSVKDNSNWAYMAGQVDILNQQITIDHIASFSRWSAICIAEKYLDTPPFTHSAEGANLLSSYKNQTHNSSSLKSKLQLFPNPATTAEPIYLISYDAIDEISIYSLTGELLYKTSVEEEETLHKLDVQEFNRGTYMIQTTKANLLVETIPLILIP